MIFYAPHRRFSTNCGTRTTNGTRKPRRWYAKKIALYKKKLMEWFVIHNKYYFIYLILTIILNFIFICIKWLICIFVLS